MKKEKSYTMTEIDKLWHQYKKITGIRFLKEGKWHYNYSNRSLGLIDATRAEIIRLKDYISFPEYLRRVKKYGTKSKEDI